MTISNSSPNGSATASQVANDDNIEYHDALPPQLRQAMANAPFKFHSRQFYTALTNGCPLNYALYAVQEESRLLHEADVKRGFVGVAP